MEATFVRIKDNLSARLPSIPGWTVPVALLAILLAAFAPFITRLGFYQDDWHHVYFAHSLGLPSLETMFLYDGRPFAAYLYQALFTILGFKPLHWQISTLFIRFLTVLFTWLYLKEIWPQHRRVVTWVVVLFAVYPLFKVQPLSVAYSVHWTGFLLFSVSIWAMVRSVRRPRYAWAYLLLGLLSASLELAFIEYFAGLELVRPFILWGLFSDQKATRSRLRQVMLYWLPYLLLLVAFFIYRVYLIPSPEPGFERNQPTVLFDLLRTPLPTSLLLVQTILQDSLYILVTIWGNIFTPDLFQITRPINLLILGFTVLCSIGLYVYLRRLETDTEADPSPRWARHALLLGLVLVILGPIPAWITGQSVSQDNPLWSGRLGMASMVGASLVVVALLEMLVHQKRLRTVVFVLLIGFAVAWHLYNTDGYRLSWIKQTRFFHELAWRAPFITPQTTLLSDEEIFSYMGEYPTSFALGTLYPRDDQSLYLNYWFYSILRRFFEDIDALRSGMDFEYAINFGRYQGNSLNSLVLFYQPEQNQCLWVLKPEDESLRSLPLVLRETAAISNLDRIEPQPAAEDDFPVEIFGPEPAAYWCTYYQQAELAAQQGHWEAVTAAWEDAGAAGFRPQNGVEILPFLRGYAFTGNWSEARALTIQANRLTRGMKHTLCPMWEEFSALPDFPADQQAGYLELRDRLGCDE